MVQVEQRTETIKFKLIISSISPQCQKIIHPTEWTLRHTLVKQLDLKDKNPYKGMDIKAKELKRS